MMLYEVKVSYVPTGQYHPALNEQSKRSADIVSILSSIYGSEVAVQERFLVLYMRRDNTLVGWRELSVGGVSGTLVDCKLVFQFVFADALSRGCCAIALAHNHPSGSLRPSDADIRLTTKIKQASTTLDIDLLDHVIVKPNASLTGADESDYFSFADNGLLV